jgi:hypothetical protein
MRGLAFAGALAAGLAGACHSRPGAEAFRLETLDPAPGGPLASALPGDFVLRNDHVVVVVEGGRESRLTFGAGGTIVDADLRRSDAAHRRGRGRDQLGQLVPTANLALANVDREEEVRVTRSSRGAEVTAAARGRAALDVLRALGVLVQRDWVAPGTDPDEVRLYTEVELRPSEALVRMTTTVGWGLPFCPVEPGDGCNDACDDALYDDDCLCPAIPARCRPGRVVAADRLPDRAGGSLLDVLLGDLPLPLGAGRCDDDGDCAGAETCARVTSVVGGPFSVCRAPSARDAGLVFGDILVFGGRLAFFLPGPGFDAESDLRRRFDLGLDSLSEPIILDHAIAVGDDVSYGYGAPVGQVLLPIVGGSITLGAVGAASCRHDQPGCLEGALVRFERWMSIGNGDAASAREALDRARGRTLGTVAGTVRVGDATASRADVYALADPRDLPCDAACLARCGVVDAVPAEVDAVIAANRCRTAGGVFASGHAAVASMARTDPGLDVERDGAYTMALAPGRYLLVARWKGLLSPPAPVTVANGGRTSASFQLRPPARLEITIVDEGGRLSPGRVLVGRCLGPECPEDRLVPLELGGARLADGVLDFVQTPDGHAVLELPAGDYEVLVARGPHRTIDRRRVTLTAGVTERRVATVARAVDRDFLAADFHVHAEPSVDGGVDVDGRITSFLAEDLDLLSSSDHDVLTDYGPLAKARGVADRLTTQVGVEVSTQELGHFIGWPLDHEAWDEGEPVPANGAPPWQGRRPAEIFAALRDAGDDPIVTVAHYQTYLDFYRLDPMTLEPTTSPLTILVPLVEPANFAGDFDAIEVMNGKAIDVLRRPTAGEVRDYSRALDVLVGRLQARTIDEAAFRRATFELQAETTRRILHRTPAEQQAALEGLGAEVACRCGAAGDCPLGQTCDGASMTCVEGPVPGQPGAAPPAEAMCRSFRGALDDWFALLDRGVRRTGLGSSDTHGLTAYEAGSPRTIVFADARSPSSTVVAAVREGRVLATNGPIVRASIEGASPGDTVTVAAGAEVRLAVRVEKAPWYDIDRVEVYENGELIHWLRGCESPRVDPPEPHGHPCLPLGDDVVVFDGVLSDVPDRDAWYVVVAMGLDGRTLAPLASSSVIPRLGTLEVAQRLYDLIPTLAELRIPRFPSLHPTFPFAVTNPIFVDVGGDGFTPRLPAPTWAR